MKQIIVITITIFKENVEIFKSNNSAKASVALVDVNFGHTAVETAIIRRH